MSKQWPKVRLADVLIEERRRVGLFDADNLPLLGVNNREGLHRSGMPRISDMSRYLRVERDWFAYNPMRINVGSIGLAETDEQTGVISPDYVVFSCSDRIIPRLLFSFLKHSRGLQEINGATAGSVRERLYFSKLAIIEIPLPPLEEQRRMVTRIGELTAHIQEARTLRNESAKEAAALMAGAERRIWPDAALRDAPSLDSLTQFLARGKQSEQGESDHYLIKTQHVQQGRYLPTVMRLAQHVALKVKPEALVQDGDILIACSAAGCLGRVARYRGDGQTASTDTHIAIARPNQNAVDPDYLYAYLCGAQGQRQLRSRERGDWQREKINFRLTELNLNDLREVPVPVPARSEQRRIVAELAALQSEVDTLKCLQAETASELDAILPAFLDRAFRGQLGFSDLAEKANGVTTIDFPSRPTFSVEDYFVQLIPALLRATGGSLALDKLNAAVALLFLPKVLCPLIASVWGTDARAHFDRFNQPLKDSAWVPMLHVLIKTGAITCNATDQVASLHLHESSAPPIKPVVEEDARFLAAIVNLIPSLPVQATVSKLCPEPAKEELLAMA